MLDEREFFIRKAIGWMLRDTGRKRPDLVYEWLLPSAARASGVTIREAVKPLSAGSTISTGATSVMTKSYGSACRSGGPRPASRPSNRTALVRRARWRTRGVDGAVRTLVWSVRGDPARHAGARPSRAGGACRASRLGGLCTRGLVLSSFSGPWSRERVTCPTGVLAPIGHVSPLRRRWRRRLPGR